MTPPQAGYWDESAHYLVSAVSTDPASPIFGETVRFRSARTSGLAAAARTRRMWAADPAFGSVTRVAAVPAGARQ